MGHNWPYLFARFALNRIPASGVPVSSSTTRPVIRAGRARNSRTSIDRFSVVSFTSAYSGAPPNPPPM